MRMTFQGPQLPALSRARTRTSPVVGRRQVTVLLVAVVVPHVGPRAADEAALDLEVAQA